MTRSIIAFTLLMVIGLLSVWGGMNYQILVKKPVVHAETIFEVK
ncbi:MAG: hypothetical protein RLZ92_223, partial [Pseudomonadota bacterium]